MPITILMKGIISTKRKSPLDKTDLSRFIANKIDIKCQLSKKRIKEDVRSKKEQIVVAPML